MSADNRLLLAQDRWGNWCVWNASASMGYHEPPFSAHQFAIEQEARSYMATRSDDYFEYGHQVLSIGEQESALVMEIADLTERLQRLRDTGCQWDKSNWVTL